VLQQAENRRRLKDEDVRALAEIGLFSAGIIHEVKNALQGIANALILLDGEKDLKPRAREWVGVARRELSRAIDVSRDTLALVREENAVPVRITDINGAVVATPTTGVNGAFQVDLPPGTYFVFQFQVILKPGERRNQKFAVVPVPS